LVPGVVSLRKWPGREADCSPARNAKIKNAWRYTYTPPYDFMVSTATTVPVTFTLKVLPFVLFVGEAD
jgi:hypothetical protein